MSRFAPWYLALGLAALVTAPAFAQNAVGLSGVISNQDGNSLRQQNAFGLGASVTFDVFGLVILGRPVRFKAYGALDYELINGTLNQGKCRDVTITGDKHFYSECGGHTYVDPTKAEAPIPTRFFWGAFAVLDVWRFRVGYAPRTRHFNGSDQSTAWLAGFALTPVSWVMVELPEHGGFRLRIEGSIWADPLSTF